MKLETFFSKFDQLADAPDAVAKMRELVLELAVRGKLVVQNVTDEPASQLLKRVLAEKNRRAGRGERSDEEQGSIPNDEKFEIPANWEWIGATTPAVIVSDQGKKVQTKDILEAGKYPVVDQGKMFIRGYCDDSERVISVAEPIVLFGDHTRETKFIDFDFVVGADGVKLLQPICIDPCFYFLVLRWLPLESRGYARHFKLLKAARIPLAPLAEQKRIVAKVDELMALCDQLEEQQQERETRHAALARASLARLADAPTLANLPSLFHKSYDIPPADLRKSILTLAVQGKLVAQYSAEGDGHALLKRIHEKSPPLDIDTEAGSVDSEMPSFPGSWASSKLGEVAEIVRGVSFPGSAKSETRSDGDVACLRTASVQAEIDWVDLIFIAPSHVSRPGQWVAPNDILISMANSYALVGKVAIVREVPQKATFGAFLAAIRPILIEPYFLLCVLRSPRMQAAFRASSSQTTNIANISLGRMRPLPFPLPPLAEQKRIVAKVDELMALVDELETQLAASRAAAESLLAAVVNELTARA
jgi:type I restriction enzyme S subunit